MLKCVLLLMAQLSNYFLCSLQWEMKAMKEKEKSKDTSERDNAMHLLMLDSTGSLVSVKWEEDIEEVRCHCTSVAITEFVVPIFWKLLLPEMLIILNWKCHAWCKITMPKIKVWQWRNPFYFLNVYCHCAALPHARSLKIIIQNGNGQRICSIDNSTFIWTLTGKSGDKNPDTIKLKLLHFSEPCITC